MAHAIILIILGLVVATVAMVLPSVWLGTLSLLIVVLGISLTQHAQKVEQKIWELEHENRRLSSQLQNGGMSCVAS